MKHGFFAEQVDEAKTALGEGRNVCVVSEPYGGRAGVVEEVADELNAERLSFEGVDGADVPSALGDGPYVVEGVRYLYARRIDGFDPLERLAETVASSDSAFLTSWNSYARSYAEHATDLGVFGEPVAVPSLDTSETARLIASEYDTSGFEEEYEEVTSDADTALYEKLPFGVGRLIEEKSENVFERLSAVSRGNPGVARAVFENRSWGMDQDDLALSYEEAFSLRVVLSKETVDREHIRSVVRPRSVEGVVRSLTDAGVVEEDDGCVSLRPERLFDAVDHLTRRRLVW